MRILDNTIRKALAALGYELRRTKNRSQSRLSENFVNLSIAYEQCLNEKGDSIPPNNVRPRLLARLWGTPPSEAYFIIQALARCRDIPGDVCEFGVAQGETSALIANEIASSDKHLHLFDSFEGLPRPTGKDQLKDDIFSLGSIEAYAGTMSCPEDLVRDRLDEISFPVGRCVIHRGFVDQSIHEDESAPTAVCFAYVDFDFYEPIRIVLEYLDRVTPDGAIIIVDDYDFFSTGVKAAVDEFVHARLSTGAVYECLVPDPRYGHFVVLTKKGR